MLLTCLLSSIEDELKEKLRLEQLTGQRHSDANFDSTIHINNVSKGGELRTECRPAPMPPSLPHPSMPITVIPIPVVTPNPTGSPTLPLATLSPPAAPPLASPRRDPHSPHEQPIPTPSTSLNSPSPQSPQPHTPQDNLTSQSPAIISI